MTTRFHALTVALDYDIREDDADALIAAIRCMRGVADVTGEPVDHALFTATERVRADMAKRLFDVVRRVP